MKTATVATKYFDGAFQPDQVVNTGGALWLVGSGPREADYGTGCRLGRLDPASMRVITYRIPRCGFNVTAGRGAIFLETWIASSQAYQIHIERFSTATHVGTVFSTVSGTLCLCSDIAHTQLTYADGSLWFYAPSINASGAPEVLQLSAMTGAVEHTYPSVPQIGGTEPFIVGAPGYVWLAGGPGTGIDFVRIDVATGTHLSVDLPGRAASVYDVISMEGQLYFLYLASKQRSSLNSYSNHVGHISSLGTLVTASPNEQVGDWLVAESGRLFSVGAGDSCSSGAHVWRIDRSTLRSTPIADLDQPDANACLGRDDFRSVAAINDTIFYLYLGVAESVLYRIRAA